MPRRSKTNSTPPFLEVVSFRVTAEERIAIEEAAKAEDRSASNFVRCILKKQRIIPSTQAPQARKPSLRSKK